MTVTSWQQQVGSQRDWVWRGWRIRYTYIRAKSNPSSQQSSVESSTPILFLHGFGASIGHWRHSLSALSQSHTVYALDLLGFGGSQKAITPYNITLWVDLVHDFWSTFIREPMLLVGNSIGSLISLVTAAEYPEIAQGLVLISLPDPGVQTEAMPGWAIPIVDSLQSFVASPALLRPIFYFVRRPSIVRRWARLAYQNPDAITDELVEILATPARDRGAARAFCTLFRVIGSPRLGPSVKSLLPNLNLPILLLWGKQDRLIPTGLAHPNQYLQYNPQLKVVELDQAGHCPHDECPERVHQEIFNWIASFER